MSSKTKATAAKEMPTHALVPKLRFPKFQDEPSWDGTTIGALGSFYYGKSAPKWSLSDDAPTPCVRYGELYTKFGAVISGTYSRTNSDPETLRFSKGGEILIPRVGEKPEDFGKCCAYLPLKGIAIGEMISVFETEQNPLFYTYYFRYMYKQFAKVVEGQNVKNLYFAELEPLPIYRPSIPEQQKIAEFLSSVDELIAAQTLKLGELKTHKIGLMQQLLPIDGATQPRLRFPEFQNAGEWSNAALCNVCTILNNRRRPITSSDRKPGPYRYYGASGIVDYVDDYILDDRVVLVGEDGAKWGAFERTAFIVEGKFWVNNHAHVLKPYGVNDVLLENYLTMIDLGPFVTGAAPPKLTLGKLKEIPLPIPPDEKEGEAIAICLSSLDALIAAESQKLETLKTHKNGLMQQLYPAPYTVDA